MRNTDIVIIYILIEEKNVDYSMKMGGGGGGQQLLQITKIKYEFIFVSNDIRPLI